jgi:hypothetical protein
MLVPGDICAKPHLCTLVGLNTLRAQNGSGDQTCVKDMFVGGELIDDLSSRSMPDLYTAVGGECGAADLQQPALLPRGVC